MLVFGASKIQWEERPMAIVRNIEVIAQSPNGFDDACREAIREASKTWACRKLPVLTAR